MDILGVGFSELILILLIAMVVFGPRRLPEIAAKAGKIVRDLRNMSQGLMLEWQREITVAARLDELEETRRELVEIKKELGETQREIGQQAKKSVDKLQKDISTEISSAKNTLESEAEQALSEASSTDGNARPASDQSGEDITTELTPEEKPFEASKPDSEQPQKQDAIPDTLPIEQSTHLASPPKRESVSNPKETKNVKANGKFSKPDEVDTDGPDSSDVSSAQSSKPKEALNE